MTKSKKQKKTSKGRSVQELFGIKTFTKNGLKVGKYTLVFFSVAPTNISVLSYENIDLKIQRLMMVLSAVPDIEISCTDAAESFDTNKAYLLDRIEKEDDMNVKSILKKDFDFIDNINLESSTARQFLFIVRCKNSSEEQIATIANRVEKIITEQNFDIKRLSKSDIKRFLAIYFDASLNGELIPDYDGLQYIKGGDNDD
jgi:predicted regulator of amino acid metabolism with ACT domain